MSNIITRHPYIAGGAALGVIVLVVFAGGGGGGGQAAPVAGATTDPSLVGMGMQLQAMQMQMETHAQDLAAQERVEAGRAALTLAVSKMQADRDTMNMNLQSQLATKSLDVQYEIASQTNALTAMIEDRKIQVQEQAMELSHADTQLQIAAQLESQKASNELMRDLNNRNAELTQLLINSNKEVNLANIRATEKANESIWDKIF